MEHALLYAKSFALLLEEVQSASDMTMVRSSLLRVRRFSRSSSLTLAQDGDRLVVNGLQSPKPIAALQRLSLVMKHHGIAHLSLNAGATPRELLKFAMMLASARSKDASAPTIFEELRDASLWCVQASPAPRTTKAVAGDAVAAAIKLDADDQVADRIRALTTEAGTALGAGDVRRLAVAMATLAQVEGGVTAPDRKAQWGAGFDQAATTVALRALVAALPTCGDAIGAVIVALTRAGDAAANELIEQLLTSESMDVRRACFDVLADLRRGTARLVTLLQHEQWFVVRNAACLLGAFRSKSSEPELTAALNHADARVRAAVISSLLQIDTPSARATVCAAIRDESSEVRRRAVRGFLAEAGAAPPVDKLLQALDRETDLDVQIEFVHALGAIATADAVQKLIRLTSVESGNRPTDFRIAAAEALASARLGAAVPMLKMMLNDPDIHARAAARHLIRAVS